MTTSTAPTKNVVPLRPAGMVAFLNQLERERQAEQHARQAQEQADAQAKERARTATAAMSSLTPMQRRAIEAEPVLTERLQRWAAGRERGDLGFFQRDELEGALSEPGVDWRIVRPFLLRQGWREHEVHLRAIGWCRRWLSPAMVALMLQQTPHAINVNA